MTAFPHLSPRPKRPAPRAGLTLLALVAGLLALGLAACGAPKAERPVLASGHPDWPPIMFQDGPAIHGAGPALAKMIFTDLGLPCEFPYSGPWDTVLAKAQNGELDALVAAYKTAEREHFLVFSEPYTTDPLALFVKKGREFPFEKYADLAGKNGVGTTGDSYGQEFDQYIAANLPVRRVATVRQALDLVERGEADYFIYSLYAGQEEFRMEGRETEFVALPHFAAEEPFYLALSRRSPLVPRLPEINALIQKYKADGTVDRLIAEQRRQFIAEHPVPAAAAALPSP